MNACEYCVDISCENCYLGNPCLGCTDYQNGNVYLMAVAESWWNNEIHL